MIARFLARAFGYTLIPRGTTRAVVGGYVVGRADRFVTVPAGSRILPPFKVPALGAYCPTRGHSVERFVIATHRDSVTYTNFVDGPSHTVALSTWERWATRVKARREV